jgi:hypothetical protein
MNVQCERCKLEKDCKFFGRAADVEEQRGQSGEWLCDDCVSLRRDEIDKAVVTFRKLLGEDLYHED